jgi:hypothetical protein
VVSLSFIVPQNRQKRARNPLDFARSPSMPPRFLLENGPADSERCRRADAFRRRHRRNAREHAKKKKLVSQSLRGVVSFQVIMCPGRNTTW